MTRSVRLLALLLLVGVPAVWVLAGWFSAGPEVEVAVATRRSIAQYVDERGITRLPETYLITTPAAGRVEAIRLVEGTPVKAGEVVARCVSRDLDLALDEAKAVVERLQAAVRQSADTRVEQTALKQAEQFRDSMQSTVAAAKERIRSAEEQLRYADRELARVQDLVPKGAQTLDDLDRARLQKVQADAGFRQSEFIHAAIVSLQSATNLMPALVQQYIDRKGLAREVAEKQLAEAAVRLEEVRLRRQRSTMTSPVDGLVLHRFVSDEGYLPAGTKLLEIGRLKQLEVEADLLSVEAGDVKPGDAVAIYGPAIGPASARGTVARIEPAGFTKVSSLGVEQQRVKVIVGFEPGQLVRLLRERHLGVGYRVRVRIETNQHQHALVVPRSALVRGPNRTWQLYPVRDGRIQIQAVSVGLLNDDEAEILDGLDDGELVIPAPESALADGQRASPLVRPEESLSNAQIRGGEENVD